MNPAQRQPEGDGQKTSASTAEAFGRGEQVEPNQNDGPQKRQDNKDAAQKPQDKTDGSQKPQAPKDNRPFWKRPGIMIMLGIIFLLGIGGGVWYAWDAYHYESTDDAFIDGRIVHVAPRVPGKVLSLLVDDNQQVDAQTPLLQIDPKPFQVKVDQANAALEQAKAQYQQAIANVGVAQANAAQAEADVVVAQANAKNAERDFERFTKIEAAARSQQQLDTATANEASTKAQVDAAQKKADSMHAQVTAAERTRDAAGANVGSANAAVEQAKLDLSYTTVFAGHAGRVTRRSVEVGNYVQVGQELLDVVPTDAASGDIWVTANLKETQLAHVRPNQQVRISVDAFPDEVLEGRVNSIQNGTGAVFSLLPAENATGNYVKVVQRVPVKIMITGQPRHLLSPGMSVNPRIDISER